MAASAAWAKPAPLYAITRTVPLGQPDRWDYITFDVPSHRVYVAHGDRISVIDGHDGALVGEINGIAGGTHGTVLLASKGVTDDGRSGLAIPFDPHTLATGTSIKIGADAIVADPISGHVFVVDGKPGTISILDLQTADVIGTIDLGGKLEFAVADDAGHLYVNGEAKREIVRIDTRTGQIDARWPMRDCESPHGLALDIASRRLFSGCVNERLYILDTGTGAIVATLPIGKGSDAIAFDPKRRRILSANGQDGTLSVISEVDGRTFVPLEPVKTMISGRTLAIDPDSGRVYIAAAETDPANTPGGHPVPRPGSLRLLFLDPAP